MRTALPTLAASRRPASGRRLAANGSTCTSTARPTRDVTKLRRKPLSAAANACYCARMPHLPDFETFRSLTDGHQLVPVYRRLLSDALTPVTAFHLLDRGEHACLF